MAQPQGNSSTSGGRLDGSIGTAAVAATHFAIGVGWGGTATIAVTAGSTAQRGSCTITASASTPAQATATVVYTFPDGAFAAAPHALVALTANTNAITEAQPMSQAATTTALSWTHSVLPVSTKTYTFTWLVIA